MKNFTDTIHCKSRAHCETCRRDFAWREQLQAPEFCPNGVTQEMLDKYNQTHPQSFRNTGTVSNCCGRADQA